MTASVEVLELNIAAAISLLVERRQCEEIIRGDVFYNLIQRHVDLNDEQFEAFLRYMLENGRLIRKGKGITVPNYWQLSAYKG